MTSDIGGAHPGAHVHVGTVSGHAPSGAIIIPDAHLLFTGDFKRAGVDLVVSGDGHEIVLHDYFKGEKRAALASPDGAHLTGDIINALTGHTQFAQADGSASVAQVIGHVTKLAGTATAIRNGVSIILNQGDNVNKGDVVASGSDSTLGITFIDGTVFGLASNAKMVLNEMIYDPNGSDNKSLISLVQGTISFVAGATAKHGDMKVDTPVATMGIRGTAVLVEIDFTVPANGGAPPATFQVLVEPDGTTGSYILFDKTTLTPIATVNQAGTQTIVNGQGGVNFLSSAQLSADAQKIITDVFALKFSDLNNANTKTATNFTDSITPQTLFVKTANGDNVAVTIQQVNVSDKATDPNKSANPSSSAHIPGPPHVGFDNGTTTERALTTGSAVLDTVTGRVTYNDINLGDAPTVSTKFDSYTYQNAAHTDVTATLTAAQLAAIKAVENPLVVVQDPAGLNIGTANWTYSIADGAFDFLAVGEVLTLTYKARVDNNFALNNEFTEVLLTITITGTNDTPVITSSTQAAAIVELLGTHDSLTPDSATGTVTFTDVDLTDTHDVTITGVVTSGVTTGLADNATVKGWLSLAALTDSTDGITGSRNWAFSAQDKNFDYLAVGETVTLTYTIQVDDHNGGVVTQPVTITVTGTNDTPVITSGTQGALLTEAAGTHDSITPDTANGTVNFTDLDLSDTHDVTITGVVASDTTTGLAPNATELSWLTLGALTDSTNGATGSKTWSFSASDHYFDYLAEGEHVTLTYTVQVDDHHGGVITQPVTITINGTNDAPVAHADSDVGHIVEAGNDTSDNVIAGVATTTGNVLLNDTDLDLSDTHSVVGVVNGTVGGKLSGGVGTSVTGLYGSLLLNPDGTWTYTLDNNNPATNALAQGVHVNDVFSYTESDNHGGTSTTTLSIDITGTNDAPVTNDSPFAVTDVNSGPPVVEQGVSPGNTPFAGTDTATGNVLANDLDVDTGDIKTVQGVESGTAGGLLTDHVGTAVAGTYGSVTITDNGVWTYTLDNDAAATQALTVGYHVSDVFTYTMHDADGATSSATLTIDITGTNDAPVVAGALSDSANEGAAAFSQDLLAGANDVDSGETATLSVAHLSYSIDGGMASATIPAGFSLGADGHTLTVDPANPAFDHLALGEQTVITVSYDVQDVHGSKVAQTETVTIKGTNDAPVITVDNPAAVTEGNSGAPDPVTVAVADHVTISDVDTSDVHTLYVAGTLAFDDLDSTGPAPFHGSLSGLFTVDPVTGTVSYDKAALDYLATGQQVVATFTFDASSGPDTLHKAIAITIDGANDAPSIVGEMDAPVQAVMVAPATSVTVLVAGVTINSLGLNTETFNDQLVGHGSFHSTALVADFSGSGNSAVFQGTADGVSGAPFFGPLPGAPDTTNYLSVGGGGAETITFATEHNAFGLYWGSVDFYNSISFYEGTKLVASYSGANVTPLFSDGSQDSFSSNGYVEFSGLGQFDKVVLQSTSNAFELDNVSAGVIHSELSASVSGTLSVHDADIGNSLTSSVIGNGTVQFIGANGSTHLPNGGDIAALIDSHDVTFDTVQSNGGTAVLDWTYHPTNPYLDFLKAGDVLKIKFDAQVSDGHGHTASQVLTIELDGANSATNTSAFKVVDGTTRNDTFKNVGGGAMVFGNGGHDTFVFKPGFGSATIADFDANNDTIEISRSLFANLADVLAHAHPTNSNQDLVITDAASDTITLKGIAANQLHDSNFHLV